MSPTSWKTVWASVALATASSKSSFTALATLTCRSARASHRR
eukprot:CAMPEP_0175546084 /NCGR_PEP_ID=MMETSP0096-20121207/29608_1 /TAXON_ID=311494 /ORGANISM="Alexandrium monilatum, Strain CCMP3105" /LENGTH=41 /DNA_ID= /DNA_START= /DNA_END= /DNA_ORIENTATION=